MGFGLGAAMGAAASDPQGKPVALITGDGSFRMNLTELSTIGYYGIPVIVVIFNNGTLGMVRQWQTLFFGHRYSQTTLDRGPDFMKAGGGLRALRRAGERGGDVRGGVQGGRREARALHHRVHAGY